MLYYNSTAKSKVERGTGQESPEGPQKIKIKKLFKKVLTQNDDHDIISELRLNKTRSVP